MTRKNFYYGALVLGAAATLTLGVTLTVSISRSHRKPSPASSAPMLAQATTSSATEPKGGQKEGIKVHGHWTIDVRNPDGKLVTHREFENALQADGAQTLSKILARVGKPGRWVIRINIGIGNTDNSPWGVSGGWLFEPGVSGIGVPFYSTNLSLCYVDSNHTLPCSVGGVTPPVSTFLLSGSISAATSGTINQLSTNLGDCPPDTTGVGCNDYFANMFTSHQLAPVVNVDAGQIIQVTVAISFQ